jgi:hypothetical protein
VLFLLVAARSAMTNAAAADADNGAPMAKRTTSGKRTCDSRPIRARSAHPMVAAAILPAGMQGDRASVFFAKPEDIAALIKHEC